MSTVTTLVDQFEEQGYVVVPDVLDPQRDLQPIIDDYAQVLDRLALIWYGEGKLSSTYAGLPFNRRFIAMVEEAQAPWYQFLDISLPQKNVTEQTPIHLSEAVFNLLSTPAVLDVVEQLIGPEIYCNPIQHVRLKPPERLVPEDQRRGLVAQTAWHQDQGVALPEADETSIITVWIPITDATEENGCLRLIPGSNRTGLTTHCPNGLDGILHIPDKLLGGEPLTLPMKRGSVLFMHRRTKHSSWSNLTDDIRWSFDLRYQPIGQPTGRPAFPGFVVRSKQNPERVLKDYETWMALWYEARSALAQDRLPEFNRWQSDSPACA